MHLKTLAEEFVAVFLEKRPDRKDLKLRHEATIRAYEDREERDHARRYVAKRRPDCSGFVLSMSKKEKRALLKKHRLFFEKHR
ncbi:MAG: uncharacterized protein A8A55_0499 [Amphiamblys sp. WSBS2006]|nr:MAG: uncharacterized protein A8A55_0499 [Amphiamblys sp. WSBS2006]